LAEGRLLLLPQNRKRQALESLENNDPNAHGNEIPEKETDVLTGLSETVLKKRVETLNTLIETIERSRAVFVHYDYSAEARAGGAVDQRSVKQQVVRAAVSLGLRRSVVQALQGRAAEAFTNSWLLQVVCDGWRRPPSPVSSPVEEPKLPQVASGRSWSPGVRHRARAEERSRRAARKSRASWWCCCP
jgi:hypothetical protein